jgi:hypothetical protein
MELVVGYYVYVSSRCRVAVDRISLFGLRLCVGVSTTLQTAIYITKRLCGQYRVNIAIATRELIYVHSGLQRRMNEVEEKLKGEVFDRDVQIEVLKKTIKKMRKDRTRHAHKVSLIDT